MNFIWDIVLKAEEQGLEKEKIFFRQAKVYSPYYEPSFSEINLRDLKSADIDINALYRFSHIFQELLHPDFLQALKNVGATEFSEFLFDFIIHFLSEIDLQHGLSRREYFIRQLRRDLLFGVYGKQAADAVSKMNKKLQLCIANELLTQIQTGSSLLLFRRAVVAVFANCILYQSNFQCKELFLYIDEKDTAENIRWLQFILEMFLPFGFSVRVFWQYHFGIIGIDTTMRAGQIALF